MKSEKRLLIEQKQKEVRIENIKNKCRQFDIRILELEEEIEKIEEQKNLCNLELEKLNAEDVPS